MQPPSDPRPDTKDLPQVVLELQVRNHPGTLSHIAGLFSRRAFNLEAVMVLPEGDGSTSRMWLKVAERRRLPQVISQLHKREDVLSVELSPGGDAVFTGVLAGS